MPITICGDLIISVGLSDQYPDPPNITFIIMQDQEKWQIFPFENLEQPNLGNFSWKNNLND